MAHGKAKNGFRKIFIQNPFLNGQIWAIKKYGTGLERWKDEKT